MRATARRSFPRAPGQPAEWQTVLKLAAVATGADPSVDALALDAAQATQEVQQRFGDAAPQVLEATAHLQGPDRLLDMALRTGPYGDQFGRRPDGLNLAKVQAATPAGGIDLGPLAAAPAGPAAHDRWPDRAGTGRAGRGAAARGA
jgi:hypothetical protein